MKKIIAALLLLILCLGLCACGVGGKTEVTLPTVPEQISTPTQFDAEDVLNDTEESTESTGETYPWEAEFNEEDYGVFQFPGQISYRIGGLFGREVRNIDTSMGDPILDTYYYPSGNPSHCYTYYADGTFLETHCLDNGYTDENGISYSGAMIYQKIINPDGSWNEMHFDEKGTIIGDITMGVNGVYREIFYYENRSTRLIVESNASTNSRNEMAYYESGNLEYTMIQTSRSTQEEHYDEEGYCTYFYSKDAGWEIELISDESGALVKILENGKEITDPAIMAQYAEGYNFKQ